MYIYMSIKKKDFLESGDNLLGPADNVKKDILETGIRIKKKDISFLVSESSNMVKWWIDAFSSWENETFDVFDKFLTPTSNFIDLGAWIGTTCLYASNLSKHIYAFEADPVSLKDLRLNISVNKFCNITIIPKPIHHLKTQLFFGPKGSGDWNTSTSQLKLSSNNKLDVKLETITFPEFIRSFSINNISLIKIDIESGEEHIIPDVFNYTWSINPKPAIYLSFHFTWWKEKNLKRFIPYWTNYKYAYYKLKLISMFEIENIISQNPFGTILFTEKMI